MTENELLQLIEQAAREEWTELDLSGNNLTVLPPDIGKLTHLKKLILGKYRYNDQGYIVKTIRNKLSVLPREIGQLYQLEELQVVGNQLQELPPEIVQLTSLQSLSLGGNNIQELPPEIVQLTSLQSLSLGGNNIQELLAEIVQLTSLQSLNLWNNKLQELPAEIVQLTSLQSLHLGGNNIQELPAEIVQLTSLQSLHLGGNNIQELPAEIGQLTSLQSLHLGGNNIQELPVEIGQLTSLQFLNLWNNKLQELPPEIRQLPKLEKLDLRRNPLPIPPEILGSKEWYKDPGDVQEILDFYFRIQDPTETAPLYEAKFIIVGEGAAGKTTLAKKIETETYQLQPDEKSTQGIDVIQWHFPHANGQGFCINIWDFGGQEIYHQTHQFFLTKRSLYALVADERKENTDFYWWLKVVELLSDNSPVLIIKNEKQDRKCPVNERQLRGEFTNLKEVIPANFATNRGLTEIKDAIEQYITHLPHVGTPLPKLWVRIRAALENDSRNYITQQDYDQICHRNQLTDRQDMRRLSRYLHDLGVCLHFQDDPTLKHYIILKPEWGTSAVYNVLDNPTVQNNLGCFTQDTLADIWQEDNYSPMQDELLQLMIRFKLCYPIPNQTNTYIAPQLLDINQPDYDWDDQNNLILRYDYDFMPKGILTRFIVETHPWIENQTRVWRSGVLLNKYQTRAEIIEYYYQRQIKIRVSGHRKKELLAVITHELEKIHESYERLRYTPLVPCNCNECLGSPNPYSYRLDNLRKRLNAGRYQIECDNSYQMVDVRRLIDDVNLCPYPQNQVDKLGIDSPVDKATDSRLQQELNHDKDQSLNRSQSPSSSANTMNNNYTDFELVVTANRQIRAASEQGEERGEFRFDSNEIELALGLIESRQTNQKLLKTLGTKLYQALFPAKIHGQFRATLAGAQANNHNLRLRLRFESPELAALPWEFLYDEDTNTFLANDTQTALSRYIDIPLQKRDLISASLPLNVLLVISSPTNLAPLDIAGEERLIRDALAKHIEAGKIELDVISDATIRNINQKLREKPYHVFHFIGHGVFKNNQGYIALVDQDNNSKLVDDETFANLFLGNRNLGLAVLNSCQGAAVSSNQVFAGIAPNLVRRNIPGVIAMQYSILDTTAKLFADEFYRTLALGWTLDAAIQTTRNAISMEVGSDKPDFATPVLYMRAKDGRIMSGLSVN
jgi:GTPase SAR1 family protein/CHAT domain-containing protein